MDDLQTLIDRQREESIRLEYRDQVSDAKACGILVAKHFKWDGAALLELAAAALADANFDGEAERVEAILAELA
jgi:hypothetical protein